MPGGLADPPVDRRDAGDATAGPSAVGLGWGGVVLAAIMAVWVGTPMLRPGGPHLAALRPPVLEADRPAVAGAGIEASPSRGGRKVRPATPLDLNRATAAELAGLPGIGPVMAARIVEHRQAVGGFPHLAALRAVSGIGPKRFAQLAPHLRVTAHPRTGASGTSGAPAPIDASRRGADPS